MPGRRVRPRPPGRGASRRRSGRAGQTRPCALVIGGDLLPSAVGQDDIHFGFGHRLAGSEHLQHQFSRLALRHDFHGRRISQRRAGGKSIAQNRLGIIGEQERRRLAAAHHAKHTFTMHYALGAAGQIYPIDLVGLFHGQRGIFALGIAQQQLGLSDGRGIDIVVGTQVLAQDHVGLGPARMGNDKQEVGLGSTAHHDHHQ